MFDNTLASHDGDNVVFDKQGKAIGVLLNTSDCWLETSDLPYFERISKEHDFQVLRESDKPGIAYRTGVYITAVDNVEDTRLQFHLLRCSTNFEGPTEDLGPTDIVVMRAVEAAARKHFKVPTTFNHVLAQIYNNDGKRKAAIKRHSDKTKDMPQSGLIAFVSFYDGLHGLAGVDNSTLTRLRFRHKHEYTNTQSIDSTFDVTLFPDSVLLISLEVNRMYTHEIVPPSKYISTSVPTRMGYVVRCSKTLATHQFVNGSTCIDVRGEQRPIRVATGEELARLRRLYNQENTTAEDIDYSSGDTIQLTMNPGDLLPPSMVGRA
jgi:hypothetical protein